MTSILISGRRFTVPSPYSSGHVCNAAEAEILNRKLHENLRTNFAKRLQEEYDALCIGGGMATDADVDRSEREFADYVQAYRLGGLDPADEEALNIARQIVRVGIKSEGNALGDYPKSEITKRAQALLDGPQGGEIRISAAERVRAIQKAAKEELRRIKRENGQ